MHLFYCDLRQSQQKGSCEKNHTELRQILPKGLFCFDDLNRKDMAVVMSHLNSNPRGSLGGKTPIEMLKFVYGDKSAQTVLDAFGIEEIPRDNLTLKPCILNQERRERGEEPLQYLE